MLPHLSAGLLVSCEILAETLLCLKSLLVLQVVGECEVFHSWDLANWP